MHACARICFYDLLNGRRWKSPVFGAGEFRPRRCHFLLHSLMTKLNLAAAVRRTVAESRRRSLLLLLQRPLFSARTRSVNWQLTSAVDRLDSQLSVTDCRKSTYILLVSACQLTSSVQVVPCRLGLRNAVIMIRHNYVFSCTEASLPWSFSFSTDDDGDDDL